MRFAVMGHPVAHSLSPIIHQRFAEQIGKRLIYEKIEIDLARFEQQVLDFFNEGGSGLNITLPCKQRAFAMSAKVSERSAAAKAANTLWMEAGRLHADNTDGVGLLRDMNRYIHLAGKRILLLGAGGAAHGILGHLLLEKPAELMVSNRTPERARALQLAFPMANCCAFTELAAHVKKNAYDVVINATSASLNGKNLELPANLLATKPFCYDLAYRCDGVPPFVAWARTAGSVAVDGLGLLVEQAAEAFRIWHGVMPDTAPVLNDLRSG